MGRKKKDPKETENRDVEKALDELKRRDREHQEDYRPKEKEKK